MIRSFTVVIALAVAATSLLAQQQPTKAPVFRSLTNVVRVDVIVRDKDGKVVRGLTAKDFDVFEDGKPQQINSFGFEEVTTEPLLEAPPPMLAQLQAAATKPGTAATATASSPAATASADVKPEDLPGRRLILLLFDTSSMQPDEIDRAVRSANDYLDKQMTAADLIAIASVGQTLQILREFTGERDVLKNTLASFDSTAGTGFEQPVAADLSDVTADTDPADIPLDDSEFGIFNNDRRLIALEYLAKALAPIEQKKSIIYFSGGMSRSGSDNQVELRKAISALVKANTSVYPVDSRGLQAVVPGGSAAGAGGRGGGGGGRGGGSSVFSGRSMMNQFASLSSSQETLTTLASDTGGQAFLDTNDFAPAFERVQRDMSAYYLIGYDSTNTAQDGKFRKISVRVKTAGLKVEARNGYYASADFAHLKKEDREHQLQDQITSAVSATDLPVVASTSWFRVQNDRFYVPVSLAVLGSSLPPAPQTGANRGRAEIDVLGVITDEQGRSVGRIRDTMQIPGAQLAELANKQLQYQSGVTLPAGHFNVKVAVRENTNGTLGAFEFPIAIPDLKTAPLKVSSVVFSTQLRFARGGGPGRGGPGGRGDFPGGRGGFGGGPGGFGGPPINSTRGGGGPQWGNNSVNPLLQNGQEIVQSLSHVATKDQRMYFYFEVYDPAVEAGGAPNVRASLAFYRGRVKVFETPVIERTSIDAADRHATIFQLQLPASDLKPGLYTCQVNVIDEVAGKFAFPRLAVYVK